jgi:hypothetical protein
MTEGDPLDRALPNLDAVMLPELVSQLRERLIGGEVHDRPLQKAASSPMG